MNVVDIAPTRRNDLAEFLSDVEALESIFATWDETQRGAVSAYRQAIEQLHGEALTRLVRALKTDPAALAAMKRSLSDEIVYAVLRKHEIIKASLAERVELALASIRPMLASHGGDVELITVGAVDHLDALTRKYTRRPQYYGGIRSRELEKLETRVICRIHARRVTTDAIHG